MPRSDEKASTDEIEITPEMIEAGVRELSGAYLIVADGLEPLDETVRIVFVAMVAARRAAEVRRT